MSDHSFLVAFWVREVCKQTTNGGIMNKVLSTVRNLLAACTFAFMGLVVAQTPVEARDHCIETANCTACMFGECIYACCGACEEVIVIC